MDNETDYDAYDRIRAAAWAAAKAEAEADPKSFWNTRMRYKITWRDGGRLTTYDAAEGPAWQAMARIAHSAIWWLGQEDNVLSDAAARPGEPFTVHDLMSIAESAIEQGLEGGRITATDLDRRRARDRERKREVRESLRELRREEQESRP